MIYELQRTRRWAHHHSLRTQWIMDDYVSCKNRNSLPIFYWKILKDMDPQIFQWRTIIAFAHSGSLIIIIAPALVRPTTLFLYHFFFQLHPSPFSSSPRSIFRLQGQWASFSARVKCNTATLYARLYSRDYEPPFRLPLYHGVSLGPGCTGQGVGGRGRGKAKEVT